MFFLGFIGISAGSALTFGLLWFLIIVVGALPGGVLLLRRSEAERGLLSGEAGGTDSANH